MSTSSWEQSLFVVLGVSTFPSILEREKKLTSVCRLIQKDGCRMALASNSMAEFPDEQWIRSRNRPVQCLPECRSVARLLRNSDEVNTRQSVVTQD